MNKKQEEIAFHFSNCQPLWIEDNFAKGNKLTKERKSC